MYLTLLTDVTSSMGCAYEEPRCLSKLARATKWQGDRPIWRDAAWISGTRPDCTALGRTMGAGLMHMFNRHINQIASLLRLAERHQLDQTAVTRAKIKHQLPTSGLVFARGAN